MDYDELVKKLAEQNYNIGQLADYLCYEAAQYARELTFWQLYHEMKITVGLSLLRRQNSSKTSSMILSLMSKRSTTKQF